MKLTIRDIAEMAGVSVIIVSQVLNNRGSRFSDKTGKKVLSAMNEHHYKPDYFVSNMINRRSRAIGVIIPDVTDFFSSKLIEGVESCLSPLGYVIMLYSFRHSQENEIRYLQELPHCSVGGILLTTPNILPEKYTLDSGLYQKIPIILIDRRLNRRDNGRLIVGEYEGAHQAVPLFTESGHTKIDMLKETTGYYQLEEYLSGYHHALKDHDLPFNGKFAEHGGLIVQGGYTASKKLLEHKDIMAIFYENSAMAIGCCRAIDELGKKIPEDIPVIGFDGLKLSGHMIPQLMTVQQPGSDIGFYTARFLIDTIESPQRKVPNKVSKTELIIRESVKVLTKG